MSLTEALHSPAFHKWATVVWATVGTGITITFPDAVWWVAVMSLYANIVGHWGSYQAARAEERVMGEDTPCAACGQPLNASRIRREGRDFHPKCDPQGGGRAISETVPLDDRGDRELKERELRG